jgi:hypothetical protein
VSMYEHGQKAGLKESGGQHICEHGREEEETTKNSAGESGICEHGGRTKVQGVQKSKMKRYLFSRPELIRACD